MNTSVKQFNAKIDNKALKNKELPKKLKVLSWDKNETTDGPVFLNKRTISKFAEQQKKTGRDKSVPIDFDHSSVPGSSEHVPGQPKSIAGYGDPELIEGDGLYLVNIEWTELGEEHARNYKDLSPAAITEKDGTVIGLHSVALTPTGAVTDLNFFSADKNVDTNTIKPLSVIKEDDNIEEDEDIIHADLCKCKSCSKVKLSNVDNQEIEDKEKTKTMNANVTIPDAYKAIPQQYKNMNDTIIKKMAAIAGIEGETDAEKVLSAFLAKYEGLVAEKSEQITKKENTEDGGLKQFSAKFEALETEIKALKEKSIPMSSNMRVLSVDSNKKITREDTVAKFNAMLGNK